MVDGNARAQDSDQNPSKVDPHVSIKERIGAEKQQIEHQDYHGLICEMREWLPHRSHKAQNSDQDEAAQVYE